MTSFRVVQHQVPGQHIREYRQATAHSQEDVLHLLVKQYIPLDNPEPRSGDITIIGAHANGFPKELYEPLWDDLLAQSKQQGWRIRSIWMADVAHQGQSGIANEQMLGNEPSWHDHARDLLHLINLKREEMPRPIVGIGHSMGGAQLTYLSLMHPRLLTLLVLLDPTIFPVAASAGPSSQMGQLSTFRRDLWPSREAAVTSFNKSAFYKSWDPRVLKRWNKFGLRVTPTVIYPETLTPGVTLSTTSAQEVFTYGRPNYELYGVAGKPINRTTHADIEPISYDSTYKFYRSEMGLVYRRLPEVRPSVLYVRGGISTVGTDESHGARVSCTGTGIGGSGGEEEGRVAGVIFEGVGHLVPMEAPDRTAQVAAEWIGRQVNRLMKEEARWQRWWDSRSSKQKQEIDDVWRENIGGPPKRAKM